MSQRSRSGFPSSRLSTSVVGAAAHAVFHLFVAIGTSGRMGWQALGVIAPRCLITLLLASLTLVYRADAQVLPSGQRVRVMESTSRRAVLVGQLIRQSNDTIVIRLDNASTSGNEQVWVLQADHRIEQSAGFRRRTRKGMGVGLLAGLTAGAAIGAASYSKPNCSSGFVCFDYGRGFAASSGAVLLGLPAMVIGGIIGATSPVESWQPAPARTARLSLVPTQHRLRLVATVAF